MMEFSLDWLASNYEWVFSGLGVALASWVGGFFHGKSNAQKNFQKQNAGDHSTNSQIGNVNIGGPK
jgi:hypothetical protein